MNIKRISRLTMAVSLALGSAGVLAQIDLDEPEVINYATQISPTATITLSTGGDCNLGITGTVGVEISAGTTRYLRFDLSGGATFETLGTFADIAGAETNSSLISGGAGESFVIYSVVGDGGVAEDAEFTLDVTDVEVPNTETPIQISYTVHTNDVSASQGLLGTAIQYEDKKNIPYIGYLSGFSFSVVSPTNLTASVEAGFEKFTQTVHSTATTGFLGQLDLAETDDVCNASGLQVDLDDIVGTTATLELIGDLDLIQDVDSDGLGLDTFVRDGVEESVVFAESLAGCEDNTSTDYAAATSIATDGSKAVFDVSDVFNSTYICLFRPANSTVKIQPSTYVLRLVPSSGMTAVTAPTGSVLRDGVVLEAPYFTMAPGYISRFMLNHLTPSGTDAAFTIELRTDAGGVIVPRTDGPYPYDAASNTFSGTLPAGTLLQVNAADLVSSFVGKNRGSATFTFVGSNSDMQGIYQAVNTKTGELSNVVMSRPGGGTGK